MHPYKRHNSHSHHRSRSKKHYNNDSYRSRSPNRSSTRSSYPDKKHPKNKINKPRKLYGSRSVENFGKRICISEGAYGIVYKATDKDTGRSIALKEIKIDPRKREGLPISSIREIRILSKCDHPQIIKLREIVVDEKTDTFYLVLDFIDYDLRDIISNSMLPLPLGVIKSLVRQLLSAVSYLHNESLCHRDIKCANLLVSKDGKLYLADFGLTKEFSPNRPPTPSVVTLWYRAPELLFGLEKYTNAIDIWSVGCVLAELLRNKPLIASETEIEQMKKMCDIFGTPSLENFGYLVEKLRVLEKVRFESQPVNHLRDYFPDLSDVGFDLLNRLLEYNPEKRITAEEALNHEWFNESPHEERGYFENIKKKPRNVR